MNQDRTAEQRVPKGRFLVPARTSAARPWASSALTRAFAVPPGDTEGPPKTSAAQPEASAAPPRSAAALPGAATRLARGFTLLELLIVVGIISGLSVTLYSLISVTQSNSRVAQAVQDIQLIRGAAGSWVSGRTDQYKTVSVANLAVFLPERLKTGTAKNPWAGDYAVAVKKDSDNNDVSDQFTIKATNIPNDEGAALADRLNTPTANTAVFTAGSNGARGSIVVTY